MKPNVHVRKLIFSKVSKARCTLLLTIIQLKELKIKINEINRYNGAYPIAR